MKDFLKSKTAKILLLCLFALLLLLAVWRVFVVGESSDYPSTEEEKKLCRLLNEVEGITDARAMITQKDGETVGVIIVFEGADSILTRSRVLDIASAALNIERKNVQVYPANH